MHPTLREKEKGRDILFAKVGYKFNERLHARPRVDENERPDVEGSRDFSLEPRYMTPEPRGFSTPMDISSRPRRPARLLNFLIWFCYLFGLLLLYDFVYRFFGLCRKRSILEKFWGSELSPVESIIRRICR